MCELSLEMAAIVCGPSTLKAQTVLVHARNWSDHIMAVCLREEKRREEEKKRREQKRTEEKRRGDAS